MTAAKNIININIFGAGAHAILCNFHAASEQRGVHPNAIPRRNPPKKDSPENQPELSAQTVANRHEDYGT